MRVSFTFVGKCMYVCSEFRKKTEKRFFENVLENSLYLYKKGLNFSAS